MDGFWSKKEYAARPAIRLTTKLQLLLCLECSIWQVFFRKLFTDSITARFLNRSLSVKRSIPGFFAFFFCLVMSCTPLSNSFSNSFLDTYPYLQTVFRKVLCQVFHNLLVAAVYLARCQTKVQYFPTIINDKMEFEAIKPSCGTSTPLCNAVKNFVLCIL